MNFINTNINVYEFDGRHKDEPNSYENSFTFLAIILELIFI